ncbi:MAG: hypothetical protein KGI06_02890 [Candidatus Micrarchaeota archaeon]|nr:hypothetical protein [Candidatus Micrarchaeota archaeon]
MQRNSFAYQGRQDIDDEVHDYERKAPLGTWDARKMLRSQPPMPRISKERVPKDFPELISTLKQNKASIIPTYDLPETYYHIMHHVDGNKLKIKVSQSEDDGWSKIEVDLEKGRFAEDILRTDFPHLFSVSF